MLLLTLIFVHKILPQSRRFVHYFLLLLICLSNLPWLNNVRQQKLPIFSILRCFSQHPLQIYTETQLVTSCHTFCHKGQGFSVFVESATRYIRVMKTNFIYYFSSAYWPANRQLTKKHNMYQLLNIYSIHPDDGLQICPKHVEVGWRNKQRLYSASSWFSLHEGLGSVFYRKPIKSNPYIHNLFF